MRSDFNDMIILALEVARKNREDLAHKYPYVLIDEFQDITDNQLELIKCIVGGKDSHLFCVGDDWQNIFSFAGSNIQNILNFDSHFAFPEKSFIGTNYRCPKNVVEASNHLISLNRFQMRKDVTAKSNLSCQIVLVKMPENLTSKEYQNWELNAVKDLLNRLLLKRASGERILVLSRYRDQLNRLAVEFPNSEEIDLEFLTTHRSKGREAEYVLLLGCIKGEFGFPSEIKGEKLLEIARKSQDEKVDKLEEERRLFYVALTRCKKELYLFTSSRAKSQFISEISQYVTGQ